MRISFGVNLRPKSRIKLMVDSIVAFEEELEDVVEAVGTCVSGTSSRSEAECKVSSKIKVNN